SFPYLLFSWFIGLFSFDKQERFADIVADITLENNWLVKKFSIGHILRLTPKHLKEYVLFWKLNLIAVTQDIKELEKALK
ncbi:heme biosynthesis protein HemY, partial [Francisella tularensis subsp. holarctica]|nr:heme biosynthesis protein HemY [Francisella tularensis subsp. holarctica]